MKWKTKGFFNYRLESEDGKWEITHDEFGAVICRKINTNRGWFLGCRSLSDEAIRLAEARISKYARAQNLNDIT